VAQRPPSIPEPSANSRGGNSVTRFARFSDLVGKAWKYLLSALEQPQQVLYLPLLPLKGVHIGEFLNLNRPWVKQAGINTVIDIGAHAGEFSSAIRTILPNARIYAFEPQPDCYDRLRDKLGRYGSFQAFQVALGERSGQVKFWRSSFSKSSSVLEMARLHQEVFPWSARTVPVSVQLEMLDHYLDRIELTPKVLVKIDVQGYEDRVLQGGMRLLKRVDYLLVEVSFRPLYEGQAHFKEVYDFLVQSGLSYAGNLDQLLSPLDDSILQADALFVRKV
jgi:FkbM family methyltransferase